MPPWPGQGVTTQRGAVARNGGGIPETRQASPDLHARPRTFWSPCYPWARHSLTSLMYWHRIVVHSLRLDQEKSAMYDTFPADQEHGCQEHR